MKITLVRHGAVEQKYTGCYNGHIDIGLSPKGHLQAKNLAKELENERYDMVFCSDLKRARQTLGYFSNIKDVQYTAKIREKSWGKHEGMSFDEISKRDKIEYVDFLQWIEALDGENYKNFTKRVYGFFDYIKTLKKENILIVTHSGVIKSFIAREKNISMEEAFCMDLPYISYITYEL